MRGKARIFALSDSLGETAELVARAAASQFDVDGAYAVRRLHRVSDPSHVRHAVMEAADVGAVIFYTLADPKLRTAMQEALAERDVPAVDILGPAIEALKEVTTESPHMEPGIQRRVGRSYFRKIEALEFAVVHDDGRNPEELSQAEIVLVGISRTSKTPLAVYLSYKGFKVANVPLVPDTEPPEQLFGPLKGRIIGLTGDPIVLADIRKERAVQLGVGAAKYAELETIEEELAYARGIMRRLGCPVVTTTKRAIEETADEILRLLT